MDRSRHGPHGSCAKTQGLGAPTPHTPALRMKWPVEVLARSAYAAGMNGRCLIVALLFAPGLHAAQPESPTEAEAQKTEAAAETDAAAQNGDAATPEDSGAASTSTPPSTPPSDGDDDGPGEGDRSFSHGGQFGLRVGVTGGYRMIFRYDASPYCSEPDIAKPPKDQQKFCGHVAPMALDVALSFAPIGGIEPYAWARFGLKGEPETNTNEVLILGAGARIYTMSDSAFKIFIEPAIGAEFESGAGNPLWETNNPEYKKDVVFHLAAGPQYDFARAVGIYANAGITTGILRSIHSNLELSLGVQARVP